MKKQNATEKEKQRKLTAAEEKRLTQFEEVSAELAAQGYQRVELTVGIVKANVFALLLAVPLCVAALLLFFWKNPLSSLSLVDFIDRSPLFLVILIVLIVVHELLHGLTWGAFSGKRFKDIDFGVIWSMLTPYCTCASPLSRGAYILGTLMPLIVLGLLPTLLSILSGSLLWLCLGLLMIVSAGGDILIVLQLLRYKNASRDILIYDHPTQCGCVVFEKAA